MITGDETLDEVVTRHNTRHRHRRLILVGTGLALFLLGPALLLAWVSLDALPTWGRGGRGFVGLGTVGLLLVLHALLNAAALAWQLLRRRRHRAMWEDGESAPPEPFTVATMPGVALTGPLVKLLFAPARFILDSLDEWHAPIALTAEEKDAAHGLLRRLDHRRTVAVEDAREQDLDPLLRKLIRLDVIKLVDHPLTGPRLERSHWRLLIPAE